MTDFKKDTRTAEEQAEARYPDDCENLQGHTHRTEFQRGRMHGCLDCITEQVTPRDEFIEELVEALKRSQDTIFRLADGPDRVPWGEQLDANDIILTKARERGYTL